MEYEQLCFRYHSTYFFSRLQVYWYEALFRTWQSKRNEARPDNKCNLSLYWADWLIIAGGFRLIDVSVCDGHVKRWLYTFVNPLFMRSGISKRRPLLMKPLPARRSRNSHGETAAAARILLFPLRTSRVWVPRNGTD